MVDNAGLVSIILPTYNRAALIARAIASVIAQTYPYWEMIVVDDASTDATAKVVGGYADPHIFYTRLPINCGHPSRPRSVGWLLARGAYIAYIDDDNAWRPRHLEYLVAAAVARPEAAGAYGGRRLHFPDGRVEDMLDPEQGIDAGDGLHRRDLIALMPEMWTETNFTNEDLEFWARLRQRHPVGLVWVPEILSDYYVHAGNRYLNHWLNFRRYDAGYFRRNAAFLDDPARWRATVEVVMALEPARVLDVGCGRGWTVRALRARRRRMGRRSCSGTRQAQSDRQAARPRSRRLPALSGRRLRRRALCQRAGAHPGAVYRAQSARHTARERPLRGRGDRLCRSGARGPSDDPSTRLVARAAARGRRGARPWRR